MENAKERLNSSFRKLYGRYWDVPFSQILISILKLDHRLFTYQDPIAELELLLINEWFP